MIKMERLEHAAVFKAERRELEIYLSRNERCNISINKEINTTHSDLL